MSTTISELLSGDTEYQRKIQDIEVKHFSKEGGAGSLFTEVKSVQELLEVCQRQRGTLDGDDRAQFIARGIPDAALQEDCRYLYVKTEGILGVIRADECTPETKVYIVRMKQNERHNGVIKVIPPSLLVIADRGSVTDEGTIIVSKTTNKIVTVFAGLPIVPQNRHWASGDNITAKDVITKLGNGKFLNILPRENVQKVLGNTTYKIPENI